MWSSRQTLVDDGQSIIDGEGTAGEIAWHSLMSLSVLPCGWVSCVQNSHPQFSASCFSISFFLPYSREETEHSPRVGGLLPFLDVLLSYNCPLPRQTSCLVSRDILATCQRDVVSALFVKSFSVLPPLFTLFCRLQRPAFDWTFFYQLSHSIRLYYFQDH